MSCSGMRAQSRVGAQPAATTCQLPPYDSPFPRAEATWPTTGRLSFAQDSGMTPILEGVKQPLSLPVLFWPCNLLSNLGCILGSCFILTECPGTSAALAFLYLCQGHVLHLQLCEWRQCQFLYLAMVKQKTKHFHKYHCIWTTQQLTCFPGK